MIFSGGELRRVNGGGQWAELGQPVMWLGPPQWEPVLGGFNGFEILAILDSLIVGDATYYNVIWSHVYEAQQYQHEFNFDTDLFYAEDIGLVREVYTDNNNVLHVWNLVNWEVNLITEIESKKEMPEIPAIYPNPAKDKIRINLPGLENVKIFNTEGKLLIEKSNNEIDISSLPPGYYFLQIQSKTGIFRPKIVKL